VPASVPPEILDQFEPRDQSKNGFLPWASGVWSSATIIDEI